MLDGRQITALGIGIVTIDVAAEDQAPLVRLRYVEMPHSKRYDAVDEGFQSL